MSRSNLRTGWLRRLHGLSILTSTILVVTVVALPTHAATYTIEIPYQVVREAPGESILLHTEIVPNELVGQTCSVTAMGRNNSSVHPGNDLEITSGNTVTLVGVEDFEDKTTTSSGVLTLAETMTVTLLMGPDGVYSAELSIHLECQAATTTTESTTTTTLEATSITGDTTTTTTTTPTDVDNVAVSTTVKDEVAGTEITNTTVGTGVSTDDSAEVDDVEVLPFTGLDMGPLVLLAASTVALGLVLIAGSRREEA